MPHTMEPSVFHAADFPPLRSCSASPMDPRSVREEVVVCAALPSQPTPSPPKDSSPVLAPAPLPILLSSRDPSPMRAPSLSSVAPVVSPTPVSPVDRGLIPHVVEDAFLRSSALPDVGRLAAGSSRVPPVGGDSSDDLRPVPKRSRTDRVVSPPRAWADECADMDEDAVAGSELPPVSRPSPSAVGSPPWEAVPGARDLVVILKKDGHRGPPAPCSWERGPRCVC
nr:ESX-1 secretion-associated protein EspI-like [Procambarus clarkii]